MSTDEADDPFRLSRFLDAQVGVYDVACAELRAGRKQTHWMWFIFPQLAALGLSDRAKFYGIKSLAEARAYAAHPVLGLHLVNAVAAALSSPERNPTNLMGTPDDMKLRSCLTLFRAADPSEPVFKKALDAFFDGKPDPVTERILNKDTRSPR